MKYYFDRVRKKIFTPALDANLQLLHVIFLLLLIAYPIMVDEFGFPLWLASLSLCLFISYSILLPEKLDIKLLTIGSFAILYTLFFIEAQFGPSSIHFLFRSILMLLFSVFLIYSILNNMLRSEISLKLLYQSIDCYLLLGICFAFLFRIMHFIDINSFNFPISEEFNHIYLSFVILTTVGLGDLLPTTLPAKAVVMVAGVLGQIYLVFFAGMIVGKYISQTVRTDNN